MDFLFDSTECTTTQEAEIVFIVDRSGSVGKTNFKKVKKFVNDIIDSFDIAQNKVRTNFFNEWANLRIW